MTKKTFILIVLILKALGSYACANAYQFKLYPVGVEDGKIVTIDFHIRRTFEFQLRKELKPEKSLSGPGGIMFVISSYISTYDKDQKLVSSDSIGSTYCYTKDQEDTLKVSYKRNFEKILSNNPQIELFKPESISFCDFQQKCKLVEISYDSLTNENFLTYNAVKTLLPILHDTTYYGFGDMSSVYKNVNDLCVNSVRVYKTKTTKLIIAHLCTGDQLDMGLLTDDPKKVGSTEEGDVRLTREYKPTFAFTDIKKATYVEPLLHHGYGFDVFIIR